MAQSLEQINQSLKKLEQQAIDLGDKLHLAHQGYRNVLAQTANEQLIMSGFTLCTEAYPEEFLKLSVSERNQLQTDLRQIAKDMQQDLRDVPGPQTPIENLAPPSSNLSLPQMLSLPGGDTLPTEDGETEIEDILILDDDDDDLSDMPSDNDRDRQRGNQIEAELKALFSLESLLSQRQPQLPQNPVEQVSFWHERVDDQANQSLRQVSSEVNRLMQKRKILPGQIPAPILEAAALADSGEGFGKTPHLVRMVLEAREKPPANQDETDPPQRRRRDRANSRPSAVVTIITLQLRVAELEFHDTNLISWRNQIRTLLKELKTTVKDYKQQQQKQAIANAKLAWRSTWTNE